MTDRIIAIYLNEVDIQKLICSFEVGYFWTLPLARHEVEMFTQYITSYIEL